MTILGLTALVLCGSLLAGIVGSLTGLGGGLIITPLLTLLLGVDIHYAIGAALVSVIATSSGGAAAAQHELPKGKFVLPDLDVSLWRCARTA